MTAIDLIRAAFGSSDFIIDSYLKGLKKEDLLVRAVPGMNHVAWQLGHLIASEHGLVEMIRPGSMPALPEGFEETYATSNTSVDDPSKFLAPEEYLALWKAQRAGALAVLGSLSEADLDGTEGAKGPLPPYAATVGQVMHLVATHPVLHAGQFVAVRRKLGLPISI